MEASLWPAVAAIAALVIPLIGVLLAVFSRLGSLQRAVHDQSTQAERDSAERLRIWNRLDDHEKRLGRLEVQQEEN